MAKGAESNRDALTEKCMNTIDVLTALINEGKFKEIELELETLEVSENLDVTLTYLNTVALCYVKIEDAYCEFYSRVYKAFDEEYGPERTERILSGRRPSSLDEDYKTPSPIRSIINDCVDEISGIDIDRSLAT